MSKTIIRVYEGTPIPTGAHVERILAHEDVQVGNGTNTRRLLTLLVEDCRYWLSEEERRQEPLR